MILNFTHPCILLKKTLKDKHGSLVISEYLLKLAKKIDPMDNQEKRKSHQKKTYQKMKRGVTEFSCYSFTL